MRQPRRLPFACRAVLFDLDGVLVDSRRVVERTWERWVARHGLSAPNIIERAHGRRSIETVRELAPHLDAETEVQWLAATELADTDGLALLPGASEAMGALLRGEQAVVTSGGRALATLRLRHVGLPVPEVLIAAEDVGTGKPSPEGYLLAANRLGVAPDECVVFEDAPSGIAAACAAGAMVIALTTTFDAALLQRADAVVPSLAAVQIAHDRDVIIVARIGGAP